jgi:serine protease DegQ
MLASPGSSDWAAGAHVIPLNDDLAQLVAVERGVFVVEVTRRSPAAQSGLRSGDVIVSAEGRRLNGPQQLRQIMEQSEAKEISLQVMRAKKTVTVVLKWSD